MKNLIFTYLHIFLGDKWYAVPEEGVTCLATSEFTTSPEYLIMWMGLHGQLTPDNVVAFFLNFLPNIKRYKKHSNVRIIVFVGDELDMDSTRNKLQGIPVYNENMSRLYQAAITMDYNVFRRDI